MLRRSACLGLAVSAVLASSGLVRAGDTNDLSLSKPVYLADETRKPLMAAMDKMGMGSSMDSAGIDVHGFAEGSWTYNFNHPNHPPGFNTGRVFVYQDQDVTLNQVDLQVDRAGDDTTGK